MWCTVRWTVANCTYEVHTYLSQPRPPLTINAKPVDLLIYFMLRFALSTCLLAYWVSAYLDLQEYNAFVLE